VINPCNFCVSNKTINGKQCTVAWHVDDSKISHVDPKVNDTILNLLDAKHFQEIVGGKRAPLTVNRGKIHDCPGMTLDCSESGYVNLDVRACIKKLLEEMPKDMDGTATSPAADHLLKIVDGVTMFDEATSEFFHATVAKLSFLCKCGRPDAQTATTFL
jgi:hypothetical protein